MSQNERQKPFNDAMEHLNKIEGYPVSRGGKLPLPIKIIGYFLLAGILFIIAGMLFNLFN
ncbi:hypothetical protein CQS04_05465 [Chryseomicrobium excrementi]|uniref:Amino acid transporter n=1 Tax=Chryseomicrobium excrementi TaxID=2041346 RepID=A0A2M9EZH2_9BACL|nr:hypothetical protein [Chryseomicrobium excrementi]PJK16606.1 hypothetical protein CQS04_05465 [Chryseomicrobium excrementi]